MKSGIKGTRISLTINDRRNRRNGDRFRSKKDRFRRDKAGLGVKGESYSRDWDRFIR